MITGRIRKLIAGTITGLYLLIYAAPIGYCAVPTIQTGITQPVLRGKTNSTKPQKKPAAKKVASSGITMMKLEGDISITKGNPKISLSLRDSDVKQVLRMFADKAGLNIVFHNSVKGKATLDLVNVPLNDAFRVIMQVSDLTYYIDHNTMVVMSADSAKTLDLTKKEMASIPVKYVNAAAMASFLNSNIFSINGAGLSNNQIAVTNPATNEVLVFGTYNDIRMAKKVISKFDIEPKETQFVVNHTTPKEMAYQLCNVLFPQFKTKTQKDSTQNGTKSTDNVTPTFPLTSIGIGNNAIDKDHNNGANAAMPKLNTIKGLPTGGASDFSSDSSNSSDSDSGSTSSTSSSTSSTSSSSDSDSDSSSNSNSDSSTSASNNNNNGDSSNSSSSSSSSSNKNIILGKNVIACQYQDQVQAGQLTSFAAKNMTISYYPAKGLINVIGGTVQQLKMIKDFITMNDKKEPQAYLEISIVELSDTGTRQFDNTWQMYNRYFSATFNGGLASDPYHPAFFRGDQYGVYQTSTSSSSSSTTTTTTTPALLNPTYLIGKYDGTPTLTYSINYLVKNQKGRVLANPKIIVTNGKESIIDLTSDYVRKVTSQILSTSSGAISGGIQRTYDIGKDDGIKVNITPFISPDGYVTLNIIPKYATIKEKVYETGVDGKTQDLVATLLERRNLDLKNIRIKDGETLVIGGMIKESEQKTIAKFPVLGEIPGIGFFFRNTDTTKDRQELVIMITPKIIKDDEVVNNSNSAL